MPDALVFTLVLLSAAMNAAWNSLIKVRAERVQAMAITTLVASLISLPGLWAFGWPAVESWGWLLLSVIVHTAYHFALPMAYRYGDLSQIYPIARGTAPLFVLVAAAMLTSEAPGISQLLGVIGVCVGVLALSRNARGKPLPGRPMAYALLTGVLVAAYTLVDGLGARRSEAALAYGAAMTFGGGLATGAVLLAWRGRESFRADARTWLVCSQAAALQIGASWIAVWALTRAPLAVVSALRETSVLWVALLSAFVLKENVGLRRLASTILVLCGLLLMRFSA